MATLAVLPVKSFGEAKHRLHSALSPARRRALAESMFADVLNAVRRASSVQDVLVITGDDAAQQIAGGHGALFLTEQEPGHNAAAALGIHYALEHGYDRLLLIPGDCPTLRPRDVDALISTAHEPPSALIVPDRHGEGTNALLLTPPDVLIPAFGPGSCERHVAAAQAAGIGFALVSVPALELDVDTPEDLEALRSVLDTSHGSAAHTRGMLNQMLRSRN